METEAEFNSGKILRRGSVEKKKFRILNCEKTKQAFKQAFYCRSFFETMMPKKSKKIPEIRPNIKAGRKPIQTSVNRSEDFRNFVPKGLCGAKARFCILFAQVFVDFTFDNGDGGTVNYLYSGAFCNYARCSGSGKCVSVDFR